MERNVPGDTVGLAGARDLSSRKKILFIAIAVVVVGSAGTATVLAANQGTTQTDPNQKPDKQPGGVIPPVEVSPSNTTPIETQPVTQEDITVRPKSVVEHGLYNQLSPEKKVEIDKLNAMSAEEFFAQPMNVQLEFGQFLFDNNIKRTQYLMTESGSPQYKDLLKLNPVVSPESTALDIYQRNNLITLVQATLQEDEKGLNKLAAKKMVPLLATQQTKGFNDIVSSIDATAGTLQSVSAPVISSKATMEGQVPVMIINTGSATEGLAQTTYKYTSFKDIDGVDHGAWQATLSVAQDDGRFNPGV